MDDFEQRLPRLFTESAAGPVSDERLAEAREVLGVELPASLVALLRVHDGGYLRDELRACPAPGCRS